MTTTPGPSARAYHRDRTTWFAYLLLGYYAFLLSVIGPSLPGLRDDLRLSYTEASLHGTMLAVGLAIVGLVGARVIGRFGRRRTVWAALAAAQGAVVGLAWAPALPVSLASMLVLGACGGLLLPLPGAILSDLHGGRRSVAISESNALASLTSTLAPLLVGLSVALGLTWRGGVVLPSGIVALLLVAIFRRQRVDTAELHGLALTRGGETFEQSTRARLPGAYWRHWLSLVLVVSVEWGLLYWLAGYARVRLGVDEATASSSVAPFLVGMLVGRLAVARLARFGPTRLLVGSLLVVALGFAAFWSARSLGLALVGIVLAGLGTGPLYPLAFSLAISVAPGASDLATTRATLASGVAIGVAPFLLGALADGIGLATAYLIVPALVVLTFANVVLTARAHRAMAHPAYTRA